MATRVVVVGSLNLDLVVRAPRLPGPGETLLGEGFAAFPGGKGANQAVAAARLYGGERGAVALVGRVGDDDHGRALLAELGREALDLRCVTRARERGVPTGVAAITVAADGANCIVVAPGANATLSAEEVRADLTGLGSARVIVAQLEVPLDAVRAAAEAARQRGALFVLNAAPARALDAQLLGLVDVLVVNQPEAEALSGVARASPGEQARALLAAGARAVVLTLGERGALWVDARAALEQPAPRVRAVDSTAAGDACVGALAHALAEGEPPASALRRACAAGALAVTRRGAIPSLPTAEALEILLSGRPAERGSAS